MLHSIILLDVAKTGRNNRNNYTSHLLGKPGRRSQIEARKVFYLNIKYEELWGKTVG